MLSFKCNCSKERFGNAIIGLGEKEIHEMIEEDGQAEANCHFCLESYVYLKRNWKVSSMKYSRSHNEKQAEPRNT